MNLSSNSINKQKLGMYFPYVCNIRMWINICNIYCGTHTITCRHGVGQGGSDRVGSRFGPRSAHPRLLSTHMQTFKRDLTTSANDLIKHFSTFFRYQIITYS